MAENEQKLPQNKVANQSVCMFAHLYMPGTLAASPTCRMMTCGSPTVAVNLINIMTRLWMQKVLNA